MRVLIVGAGSAEVTTASRLAIERGATLRKVADGAAALAELYAGRGADLVLIDAKQDIAGLIRHLAVERIFVPVVGYGIGTDTRAAVAAVGGAGTSARSDRCATAGGFTR